MNDRIEKARMQYIYDDWEEYPQEAIEISEREEIMQDSKENFRKAIEDNLPLPPSVSELIESITRTIKVNERWDTNPRWTTINEVKLRWILERHLKPQSEEVEKTSEYVIEKIISFVCFKIEMIGVVSKRREDEFVWDLRDYLTDLLRSSEAECGDKPSEEVEIKRITRWYHKCKCWYWEVRYDNKYCPNCWKKILRVDQPIDEKWEEIW